MAIQRHVIVVHGLAVCVTEWLLVVWSTTTYVSLRTL